MTALSYRPHITGGALDEHSTRAGAIASAILHRHDPRAFPLTAPARQFHGHSLPELARECLEASGVRTAGMSRSELAGRALEVRGGYHSTSDFPSILADVANKTLRAAYDQAPRTFTPFTRRVTARDFKAIHRVQLGEAPQLARVGEHGEYQRGTITEGKESYKLATYGRTIAVTRQAIINDDTEAFTRIPALYGQAAAQLESDLIYAVLLANAAMADGVPLFHSSRNNTAASGGAISVATVGAMRAAMRQQKGLDGKTLLNVALAGLIVPPAKETEAAQLLTAISPATTAAAVPERIRSLGLVVEPRLESGVTLDGTIYAGSATAWYGFASPAQIDTIEYALLEGEEGVRVDVRQGWSTDGVEIRARLDVAAAAIDHRDLAKNPGA